MKSKKRSDPSENYLEKIPVRPEWLRWSADESGAVTLDIENKGFVNRIAQKLLKKPKVSHIHLDEMGSFIWPLIDGKKSVLDISVPFEAHFGEKAQPLYERIAKYFQILESYGFIEWSSGEKSISDKN